MLDTDLAQLYGVSTKRLNEQVKRNRNRFPVDFMLQLNPAEVNNLRSHLATSKKDHGGRRYAPYAFTEHGAIMLAAILNTPRAIEVSVFVVRAFVRFREILTTHKALAHKLAELESKIETHDEAIRSLVSAIRQLMAAPEKQPKKIGFQLRELLCHAKPQSTQRVNNFRKWIFAGRYRFYTQVHLCVLCVFA
jgi:phage regulator Rha-like protein